MHSLGFTSEEEWWLYEKKDQEGRKNTYIRIGWGEENLLLKNSYGFHGEKKEKRFVI